MKKVFMLLDKHLEEILLVFGTMVMILLIFYQVVMRRCFNSSIAWSEELARYIFIWQVWLAVPYTVTNGQPIYTFPKGFTAIAGRMFGTPSPKAATSVLKFCLTSSNPRAVSSLI